MSRLVPSLKVAVTDQIAVAGRLRREIEHVLDAVHLLLQRRRHRVADHLGRGAGIARADLDGRRRDFRVLRDRQGEIGGGTHQGDEDREHRREDRAVDEEMREAHGLPRP